MTELPVSTDKVGLPYNVLATLKEKQKLKFVSENLKAEIEILREECSSYTRLRNDERKERVLMRSLLNGRDIEHGDKTRQLQRINRISDIFHQRKKY